MNDLKKEFEEKIKNVFGNDQALMDYFLQTKKNFLYRYLETSSDKDIAILQTDPKTLKAKSFENNLGTALKISAPEIKEGVKALAKSIPKESLPKVEYSLTTHFESLTPNYGKLILEAKVSWNFPEFLEKIGTFKKKTVIFEYNDITIYRKQLALKFEEVCELFN